MIHVDDWLSTPSHSREPEAYAKFVLTLARLPAWAQMAYRPFTKQFELFCTYQGQRYRCTGASRMGDVWLAKDFSQENGYDHRVDVAECSDWGASPSPSLSNPSAITDEHEHHDH